MEDPTPDPVDSHRPSEDLPVLYSPLISEEPLKAATKYYVIDNPRIVSVREGQRELLRKLFCIFMEALEGKRNRALLPQATQDRLESGDGYPRLAADLLAGMTERQAIQTYQRLTGIVPGPAPYFDLWLL